jgi:hypothetical protein
MNRTGIIQRIDDSEKERGIKIDLSDGLKPIWVGPECHSQIKDLKEGDQASFEVREGRDYYSYQSHEERAASQTVGPRADQPDAKQDSPPAEQPPKLTEDFNIAYSAKKIGELYSVLVDPEGNVVDGLHRLVVNKEWRKEVLPWVRSRKDFLVARIHANLHRRTVPKEERQRDFTELANILVNEGAAKGKLAEEISELTGFSEGWVRDLLPRSLKIKEKVEAAKASHEPARLNRAQDVTSPQSTTLPDVKMDLEEPMSHRQPETLPDTRVPMTAEGFAKTVREAPSGSIDLTAWACPQCKAEYRIDWKGMKIEPT